MIIRLVLIQEVSELLNAHLSRGNYLAPSPPTRPSLLLFPLFLFATTKQSKSTRRRTYICGLIPIVTTTAAAVMLQINELKLQTNNKKKSLGAGLGERCRFQRTKLVDGIAPLETFWGSLAGLFRAGNTFFPGGVWGRIWLPRSKADKDWTNDNANHASASFWFRGFRLANELSPC